MKRIRRDERGSSLLIALIFLALFSLWVGSTLTAAEGGLHIAQTMKIEPKRLYASDGAVEQAIQKVRYDSTRGADDGTDGNCSTTAALNGKTYYVQCVPSEGSGQSPYGGSSPSLGIIALTNGGGGEVGYRQRKNGVIKVDGGLFSGSGISFENGSTCPGINCQQLNLCPNNAKTVTDGIFVAAPSGPNTPSKTVTSVSAGFLNTADETDVGAPIAGAGVAGGATIAGVASASTITMSANANVVGINRTVTFRENFPALNSHCHPAGTSHGDIRVVGAACDPTRVTAVTFHCDASPLDPLNLSDLTMNYPPDATTFTPRTVPSCPTGRIVDFLPGEYTDVVALNNLTNSCNGKIFYFHSGTYNFDFTDANPVWTMNNASSWVLAGEKNFETAKTTSNDTGIVIGSMNKNSTTLTAGTSVFKASDVGAYVSGGIDLPASAKITAFTSATQVTLDKAPGAKITSGLFAVTPKNIDAPCDKRTVNDHPGSEFIFSGASRMSVGDMRFEICSPVDGNRQQNARTEPRRPLVTCRCRAVALRRSRTRAPGAPWCPPTRTGRRFSSSTERSTPRLLPLTSP